MALWGGRFSQETDAFMKEFSSSLNLDARLWAVDIKASMAHTRMLVGQGILSSSDGEKILSGLKEIANEIRSGHCRFSPAAEDVHGEIERLLIEKVGEAGKRMHTARSRNDQVAADTRLYLKEHVRLLLVDLKELQELLLSHAKDHALTVLPGMTHMQHAQPVSLAHHLLAYFWMFQRDIERLTQSLPRVLTSPLGAAALAGTGFPIDRQATADELGFTSVAANSLDAVSDRDFVIEFLAQASLVMMHLSRFCEEIVLWSGTEFGFIELGDEVTTGSSIMPQKKNPDAAELIRGRVGRVYGALVGALTMMKALPLSYNRDMQEDKVHLFSGLETVSSSVKAMALMLKNLKWNPEKMARSLRGDLSNATDLADDLVGKGVSFREAHEIVGQIVKKCLQDNRALEDLTLAELTAHHPLFDDGSLAKLSHAAVMTSRQCEGGTGPDAVKKQIATAMGIWAAPIPD